MNDPRAQPAWRWTAAAVVLAASLAASAVADVAGEAAIQAAKPASLSITLPGSANGVKLAVIGDSGTGDKAQYEVGAIMKDVYERMPFDLVLMLGDNMYGGERPQDFVQKFEKPYKPLLDAGVKFYAALGNHDDPNQRYYKPFNMNGQRYYSFSKGDVRFFALDSNYFDRDQYAWFVREVATSREKWKICYMHHPLYSSGARHGSEVDLREKLEPLFLQHGVSVVFAGHEHFYERLKPQKGIQYFTNGGAAKLRAGNIRRSSPMTEKGFDRDRSFMIVEIDGDRLHFQTLSRRGETVDSGEIQRRDSQRTDSK